MDLNNPCCLRIRNTILIFIVFSEPFHSLFVSSNVHQVQKRWWQVSSQMKLRLAVLDDSHDLASLNAEFNGVQVVSEQLSSGLANPHRVETKAEQQFGGTIKC